MSLAVARNANADGRHMLAARLHGPGQPLRVERVPVPEPGPDEVRVRVVAAGICGSDLHLLDGESPLDAYPRTLGHEIAGVVDAVGAAVIDWKAGARVCIDFLVSCGECIFCRAGRESLCRSRRGLGAQLDGGFAEFVRVPARNLVLVPDGVDLRTAAIATDAVATPYHAIRTRARPRPGAGVVVIGLGGLGLNALQVLRLYSAGPVIGVDRDPASRARAAEMGVRAFAPGDPELVAKARQLGPEIVLDLVGSPETVELAGRIVDRGGRVVVVGLAGGELRLADGMRFVRDEVEIVGSYAFEREEIRELLEHVAAGRLEVSASITHLVALTDINQAVEMLRSRHEAPGRILVVEPEALATGGKLEGTEHA